MTLEPSLKDRLAQPQPVDLDRERARASTRLSRIWPLGPILLLGALDFAWQLGSPSYFVDEVLSIQHASTPLSSLISAVHLSEFTPPTYFVFLHEWVGRTGSQAEWVTRLPSAVAGALLVGAIYWMARAFLDRRGAVAAALLCALSPVVLEYAQQVRVYVFAMLAVTLAVGATVRGVRTPVNRGRLLVFGAGAAIVALWLHYTAALVVVPLCLWVAAQRTLPRLARASLVGGCAVAAAILAPLFLHTYRYVPNGVLGKAASVTWTNVAHVAETPFSGRQSAGVDALTIVGAAVTVLSALLLLAIPRASSVSHRRLLVALASITPLALLLGAAVGKNVLIPRYSAVAAPFMITAIAAAVAMLPRLPAAALALAALVAACVGVAQSHSKRGFYPPTREAIQYIAAHEQPGQAMVSSGSLGVDVPLQYYGQRLRPRLPFISRTQFPRALRSGGPLWITTWGTSKKYNDSAALKFAAFMLRRVGYRPQQLRSFTTSGTLQVLLAVPIGATR